MSSPKKYRASPAKVSQIVWNGYLDEMKAGWAGRRDAHIEANRCVYGFLPDSITGQLALAVGNAPRASVTINDCVRDAVQSSWKAEEIAQLNEHQEFCILDARTRWALHPVLEHLKGPVARTLACPFRLLQVRSYLTKPGATGGPFQWHFDGMAEEMLKIMIYLTDTSQERCGLKVDVGDGNAEIITGKPGLWVMLYNSKLNHCAVAPKHRERIAMELTITPWCHLELEPVSLGLNARHPMFPVRHA